MVTLSDYNKDPTALFDALLAHVRNANVPETHETDADYKDKCNEVGHGSGRRPWQKREGGREEDRLPVSVYRTSVGLLDLLFFSSINSGKRVPLRNHSAV